MAILARGFRRTTSVSSACERTNTDIQAESLLDQRIHVLGHPLGRSSSGEHKVPVLYVSAHVAESLGLERCAQLEHRDAVATGQVDAAKEDYVPRHGFRSTRCKTRTRNLLIRSQALYPLS